MPGVRSDDPRVVRSKEAILKATVQIMAEKGVAAASVEAIAQHSGVAKTTIYRHWPDRAGLLVDAYASQMEAPRDPDTGTLHGDLEALAMGLAKGLGEGPWASLLPSLIDAAERDPELARLHAEFAADRDATVAAVVARARSRGEIRAGIEDRDVIELIAGPLLYRRMIGHQAPTLGRARHIAALVVRLVATESQT